VNWQWCANSVGAGSGGAGGSPAIYPMLRASHAGEPPAPRQCAIPAACQMPHTSNANSGGAGGSPAIYPMLRASHAGEPPAPRQGGLE
jgi:hypothetical protein